MNARQFVQQQPVVRQPEGAWGRLASTCSVSASLGGLPLTPRCRQVLVKCILQPAQDTGLQATLDDAEPAVLDLLGQGELIGRWRRELHVAQALSLTETKLN